MSRLTRLSPTIGTLSSSIGSAAKMDKQVPPTRDNAPWRRWYGLARWKRLRWDTLVKHMFQCIRCGVIESNTSKLVADHIVPHRGREKLFWDPLNLQCLCEPCHSKHKQIEEQEQFGVWD